MQVSLWFYTFIHHCSNVLERRVQTQCNHLICLYLSLRNNIEQNLKCIDEISQLNHNIGFSKENILMR